MAESLGQRIFVIAVDQGRARAWGRQNKPQCHVKVAHPDSLVAPRGLRIRDEIVYELDELSQTARWAWLQTGCRLVKV